MIVQVDLEASIPKIDVDKHFLMQDRTLTARLDVSGSSTKLALKRYGPRYEIDVPAGASGRLLLELIVSVTAQTKAGNAVFRCLHVRQAFNIAPGVGGKPDTITPTAWECVDIAHDARLPAPGEQRTGLHPLVSWHALGRFGIDCTMLDVSRYWMAMRVENRDWLLMARSLHPASRIRVLASLVKEPMIWYLLLPRELARDKPVIPHVFLAPIDHAELQPYPDCRKYFFDAHVAAGLPVGKSDETDGHRLGQYFNAATDDATTPGDVARLAADAKARGDARRPSDAELQRNVNRLGPGKPARPSLNKWNTPAGFSRALGMASKRQLLFYPQRVVKHPSSQAVVGNGLPAIYRSAIHMLEGCSTVFGVRRRDRVEIGKLVLSCFSDSGRTLWAACRNDTIVRALGAVICMEPMSDDGGRDRAATFGKLREHKVAVHYIGRWKDGQFGLPAAALKAVTAYPAADVYAAMYRYPYEGGVAPVIDYRSRRFAYPEEDPALRGGKGFVVSFERELLDAVRDLPSIKGDPTKVLHRIYDQAAADKHLSYLHSLSLTAGQVWEAGPAPFYGKTFAYKTFFHEALEAVERNA